MNPWADMPTNPHTGRPFTPRRWQAEALPALGAELRKGRSPLIIAATGTGKAKLLAEVCRLYEAVLKDDECVVVGAPRLRLVRQLTDDLGERCRSVGMYSGEKQQPTKRVIVACYNSMPSLLLDLAARGRNVRLVVCDEAHRTEAASFRTAIDALGGRRCGLTATPYLSSDGSLSLFDSVAYRYPIADALADGVLVPPIPVEVDAAWHGFSLPMEQQVDEWCAERIAAAPGPGVCSANNIPDAEQYAQLLSDRGVPAAEIHSGLSRKEQRSRIDALAGGDLKCLVHPELLTEGVDLPYLRWGCLRRAVASSVRVVQEVGRFLRVYPGKRHALIFDPHGLLRNIGLEHEESIGAAMDAVLDERGAKRGPSGRATDAGIMPPPMAVDETTQWARLLYLELVAAGLAKPALGGSWRDRRAPTKRQVDYLRLLHSRFSGYLPDRIKSRTKELVKPELAGKLKAGAVSDLISVLEMVRDAAPGKTWEDRRGWSYDWPEGLEFPELAAGAVAGLGGSVSREERAELRKAEKRKKSQREAA